MPFGAKLQNHALNSRLNDEFAKYFPVSELRPILRFAILKAYYGEQSIFWGWSADKLQQDFLMLYKTGRTNANDGGIDFVMKPLGRFFQVTETIDVNKYFLDKVHRFPLTLVVKSTES